MIIKKFLKTLFRHKVSIFFSSTSYLPSFNIRLTFFSFFIILFSFILILSFSFVNILNLSDYYTIKAENFMLKNKLKNIVSNISESLEYLEAVKRTEKQLAKIIDYRNYNNYEKKYSVAIGGPTNKEISIFKKTIELNSYDMLKDKEVIDAYKRIKEEAQKRLTSYEEVFNYITTQMNHSQSIPVGWPATGSITSSFGYRIHPLTLTYEYHSGVDIANKPGTPVKTTANGVVRYSGWAMGYGLCIIIDHGFGYSTLYGHLSQVLVKEGEDVKRGEIIGKMGSTGTSTGPHLHYEVWEYSVPKNPVRYMNAKNSRF